jgi:hypothetical protein
LYKPDELELGESLVSTNGPLKTVFCLDQRKIQAMIINCPSSVAVDAPAIYLAGQRVPYSKKVKNLELVLNNVFFWENQV